MCKRCVNGAFGKPSCLSDCAYTGTDVAPSVSRRLTVEVQVNHKRSRLLIMPDQIAHQHIQNVIVEGNGLSKTRHNQKDKVRTQKEKVHSSACYTDKWTAVSAVKVRSIVDDLRGIQLGSAHHDQAN
jgi:hypothetical protein